MPRAWRLLKSRYLAEAFTGEGARLYGGRWNRPGTPVVYLAESLSLAVLEVLVHLQSTAPLTAYSVLEVEYDASLVRDLDRKTLPASWADAPPTATTQAIGDAWVADARSALLRVPSAIVPMEHDLLANPAHRDFHRLRISKPKGFRFDPRLMK